MIGMTEANTVMADGIEVSMTLRDGRVSYYAGLPGKWGVAGSEATVAAAKAEVVRIITERRAA